MIIKIHCLQRLTHSNQFIKFERLKKKHVRSPRALDYNEEPDSTKIFDYWQKTFDVFLTKILEKADDADSVNKLGLLTNYLTHKTYAFVTDTRSYDEARQALNNAYHKPKNIIFARHLLMTRT